MDYPITLPGYPDLGLSLRSGGIFTGAKILKDGVPLKKSKTVVSVPLADGSALELKIKVGFDGTPRIQFADQEIEVMPALHAAWAAWAYLPLVLIFIGGALGGLCGGAASAGTISVLRSAMPRPLRIVIALLAPPLAFMAYGAIAFMLLKQKQ